MKRIIGLFADKFMGFHTHENVGGLDADHQIVIAHLLDHAYLFQCALHNALCGHAAVLLNERLFQGAAVDTNTDRHTIFLCFVHHSLHPLCASNVARVNADFVCAAFHGRDSQSVIKMNICHQRNVDLAFDRLQAFCRFHGRHRHPDDVTARLLQL